MDQVTGLSFAGRLGRRWFKWRGVSPVPLFLLVILLPPDFICQGFCAIAIVFGVLLAEGLRIWAVGYAGSATRTRGDKVPELVHAGPFHHVRNPLYIANIVLYTLAGFLFGHIYLSIIIFIFSCLQYSFVVAYEEQLLEQYFGEAYITYKKTVPRWLFSLTPTMGPSSHRFCFFSAIRSEKSTFVAIVVFAILFWGKRFYF